MSDSEYPSEMIWSAAEIEAEIANHRDDHDWNPLQVTSGGYVVKTLAGNLVKPPQPPTKGTP